jgi:hypothetical protein
LEPFIGIHLFSQVMPSRAPFVRAEDSYYWAHQPEHVELRLWMKALPAVIAGVLTAILLTAMLRA